MVKPITEWLRSKDECTFKRDSGCGVFIGNVRPYVFDSQTTVGHGFIAVLTLNGTIIYCSEHHDVVSAEEAISLASEQAISVRRIGVM